MMDEEIRQALCEVREMKKMCGNINMKLTNIVTQRGQDYKKKLEAEYQRGLEEGYERGLAEGKKAFDLLDAERDAEYQRGLDDAWEAARKVGHCKLWDDYTKDTGKPSVCAVAVLDHTAEAIAKLKAYEEKQKQDDKIEVGDEVIYNGTTKCLVVRPETDERYAVLIDSNGNHHHADHSECKKTGRHFDIQSILEAMKHD